MVLWRTQLLPLFLCRHFCLQPHVCLLAEYIEGNLGEGGGCTPNSYTFRGYQYMYKYIPHGGGRKERVAEKGMTSKGISLL